MKRAPDAYFTGVRYYVPAMQAAPNYILDGPNRVSLGTPAANSATALDTDIDADATAGTETSQSWTADSPYGRTLTMSMDADPGAALGVYDVYGHDYLGQLVIERFTHINGSTALIYGKKAFYTVHKVVVVTPATNATTVNLGTGWGLGLPIKGDVVWAREGGVLVPVYTRDFYADPAFFDTTDAAAGSSRFIRSPCPGYVKTLRGYHHVAGSTNDPAITVELGGTAITGLTITLDVSGTAGTQQTDTPTTTGYNANNRLRPNDLIEIVGAAAASADAYTIEVEISPTQFVRPVTTDPATVSTGDPRGTYEAMLTYDGASEIVVGLLADPSVNTSGNGGLHGIAHFSG